MLALSTITACAQWLAAFPALDRTEVRIVYEISRMVWLCKYEFRYGESLLTRLTYWVMMLAARTADSVLHSEGWCSRFLWKISV